LKQIGQTGGLDTNQSLWLTDGLTCKQEVNDFADFSLILVPQFSTIAFPLKSNV